MEYELWSLPTGLAQPSTPFITDGEFSDLGKTVSMGETKYFETSKEILGLGGVIPASTTKMLQPQTLQLVQGCQVYFGKVVTGAWIYLDTCTARRVSDKNVHFLGNKRVDSQANCLDNTWTTYPERATHRPRSAATQNMLNTVCSY